MHADTVSSRAVWSKLRILFPLCNGMAHCCRRMLLHPPTPPKKKKIQAMMNMIKPRPIQLQMTKGDLSQLTAPTVDEVHF